MVLSKKTTLFLIIPKVLIGAAVAGGIVGVKISYRNYQVSELTKDYKHDPKGAKLLSDKALKAQQICFENKHKWSGSFDGSCDILDALGKGENKGKEENGTEK